MTLKRNCMRLLICLGPGFTTMAASAETWPTKPLRAIVPIAAGSIADVVPRVVFEQLSVQVGQNIVVDNRPGAGMTSGSSLAARAAPDGYTVLVTSSAHTIAPSLHANLGYRPERDLAGVIPLGVSPFVLVVPPARGYVSVRDLVAAAKAQRGALAFASPGVATASHLSAERFRFSAGLQEAKL